MPHMILITELVLSFVIIVQALKMKKHGKITSNGINLKFKLIITKIRCVSFGYVECIDLITQFKKKFRKLEKYR